MMTFVEDLLSGGGGRLLDVGCGLGFFVKKITNFPSWDAYGYEISLTAVDFSRKILGSNNIFCGRVEDSNLERESFDVITLWDVIEHIPDPFPLLLYLRSILKDDGILFMHTPNIKIILPLARLTKSIFGMKAGFHYLEAKDHINSYSPRTIKMLLHQSGFNKICFVHLKPIQSIAGSKSYFLRFMKNIYVDFTRFIFFVSLRHINIDNLFVVARK